MASFDAGEFGGALFHATDGSHEWELLANEVHVQDLSLCGSVFLAAGGLTHRGTRDGAALLIQLDKRGQWEVRQVFATSQAVPRITGRTQITPNWRDGKTEPLWVITLHDAVDGEKGKAAFGISMEGSVHYLGELEKGEPKPMEPAK